MRADPMNRKVEPMKRPQAAPLWISRAISILLALSAAANAQFTSAPGSPFPEGSLTQFVAMGDFNGDGKLDLATAN